MLWDGLGLPSTWLPSPLLFEGPCEHAVLRGRERLDRHSLCRTWADLDGSTAPACVTARSGRLTGVADAERWYDPGEVRPRDLAINPRCPDCQSPDPNGRPPMFHPAHPWGPCWVRLPDGELCPHREPTAEAR